MNDDRGGIVETLGVPPETRSTERAERRRAKRGARPQADRPTDLRDRKGTTPPRKTAYEHHRQVRVGDAYHFGGQTWEVVAYGTYFAILRDGWRCQHVAISTLVRSPRWQRVEAFEVAAEHKQRRAA